ncbi:MAG TPA: type II toxin-antitoxin system HicA family toxin [Spirochaetes bacterium]|nr:type II toxin-antitoxin system HicA family toxin [Spirochaetota bacterium]
MAKLNPISFNKLVKKLRQFGFEGPKDGGKHLYMKKDKQKVPIPNPHKKKDLSVGLLMEILRKAGIARDDWMNK